jgi:SAM-dependent methyltransferase
VIARTRPVWKRPAEAAERAVGDFLTAAEPCVLCNGQELRVLATRGRHFQELTTAICTGCGLVQTNPIPTEQELATYYRELYRREYKLAYTPPRRHVVRYARHATERLGRLAQFVEAHGTLLDVGSGAGEFVYAARLAGFEARGIEPHEGYSAFARAAFRVPVATATLQQADVPDSSIDVVTLHHVLEHLPRPLAALARIARWLRPGGVVMLDVPDVERSLHAPANRFHHAHVYNFNHFTLRAMLLRAGLEIIEHPGNAAGTSLAVRRAERPAHPKPAPMADNYHRLWALLTSNGEAFTPDRCRPVRRALGKCYRYPLEFMTALWLRTPKRIVEAEGRLNRLANGGRGR